MGICCKSSNTDETVGRRCDGNDISGNNDNHKVNQKVIKPNIVKPLK